MLLLRVQVGLPAVKRIALTHSVAAGARMKGSEDAREMTSEPAMTVAARNAAPAKSATASEALAF